MNLEHNTNYIVIKVKYSGNTQVMNKINMTRVNNKLQIIVNNNQNQLKKKRRK